MSKASAFDPTPAQKSVLPAKGPAAARPFGVRPFAEGRVKNGVQRDVIEDYVRQRKVAAATEKAGRDTHSGQKRTWQRPQAARIQRLGVNEEVPSIEEQAALLASKDADLENATESFRSRVVRMAKESIEADDKYTELRDVLRSVIPKVSPVKTEGDYQKFWRELILGTPSRNSHLIGLLRSSSRQRALQEIAADTPISPIPETYSFLEDNLIREIIGDGTLNALLEKQFKGMVGLRMYVVNKDKEMHFFGRLLKSASPGEEKSALTTIISSSAPQATQMRQIQANEHLIPLVKRNAMALLEEGIISPPGGHDQLYAVLQKNADDEQRSRLEAIYGALEEHRDKAESQVLKKAAGQPRVKEFLKARNDVDIAEFDWQVPALRDALMGTLFVARLLDPKMAKQYPVDAGIRGEWRNGGTLADDVEFTQSEDGDDMYEAIFESQDMEAARRKIRDADAVLKDLVNKSVLSKIVRPQVRVDRSFGHRAFQHKDHISVAIGDGIDIIVHEVGHYIETSFPQLWFEASLLLHSRHQKSGGLNAQSDEIGEQENVPDRKGRYRGEYPATGPYTSKIYETSGATELVAMTMEYLSDPKKALDLIREDPFQALLVLRRIQPDDGELQEIFKKYEKNLPHSDSEERQRLLKRIKTHKDLLTEMSLADYFTSELGRLDTMGLPSLRVLEDQMGALPTGQRIVRLLEDNPDLNSIFETELEEARNYPVYKLNELLRAMQLAAR